MIISGANTGFTGTTQLNAGSVLSISNGAALGSGVNAGSISMLAGSTLFLNNLTLANAVSVTGDPNIEAAERRQRLIETANVEHAAGIDLHHR